MYTYKIEKINRIIDGDTIDVTINLGFGITVSQRIRLKGINAAETRTLNLEEKKKGLDAKEWLKKELSGEGEFIIKTFKEDKYGRILGILYHENELISINDKMLNEKIVKPYL